MGKEEYDRDSYVSNLLRRFIYVPPLKIWDEGAPRVDKIAFSLLQRYSWIYRTDF